MLTTNKEQGTKQNESDRLFLWSSNVHVDPMSTYVSLLDCPLTVLPQ